MYNLNGENVNDNPNGFSGNEPAGTPNPDNNAPDELWSAGS